MKNIETILTEIGITLTDEQKTSLSKEHNLNYKTIEEFNKKDLKLKTAETELKTLKEDFEKVSTDGKSAEEIQKAFDEFKTKVENDTKAREQAEKDAKADADLKARFDGLVGENKWYDEDIKNGRYNAFKDALNDETNKGKGDKDIFEAITKDRNCFENPQGKPNLPNYNNTDPAPSKTFKQMSYNERNKLYNENRTLYDQMKGQE